MVESHSHVQREGVYRWFSSLTSAQRAEFLCGLLDLCVPIELRFLGSCLEDLARKDYHSLRDAEIKANNPTDLSGLTNITDEVVRSKLLVSLALLGSDNREAAWVLYQTLTHIDTVINNYGLALNDGRAEEQFLLLFTMASNHPAFSFHQKRVLRQQLGEIQDVLQNQPREASTAPALGSGVKIGRGAPAVSQEPIAPHLDLAPPPPTVGQGHDAAATPTSHQGKRGTVAVERVALRGVTHKFEDKSDYMFEASWSDGFVTSVVRSQQEVSDLLSQLSQAFPDERMEKLLPQSSESDARCLTMLPSHVLQHHSVQIFFTSTRALSPNCLSHLSSSLPNMPPSPPTAPVIPTCPLTSNHTSSAGCMVQYRGASRAVYRVASVQPVVSTHNSALTRSTPHLSSLPLSHPSPHYSPQLSSLPPTVPALPAQGFLSGRGDVSSQPHPQSKACPLLHPHAHSEPQQSPFHPLQLQSQPQHSPHSQSLSYSISQSRSQPHAQSPSQSQANAPEQNGILDWLRKLRLHKYYPVFKQLTMEEFLALTEDDLNKYDLTQGAKKKLKTQLELQKSADREMKLEKRTCGGIARVMPSSHMGPSTHTSTAVELRVEVDSVLHHQPIHADSSSSSGYSSSSCSPRTPLCCDAALDRSVYRLCVSFSGVSGPDAVGGGQEKERSCIFILNSSCPAGPSRPTAQVLPVQTDISTPAVASCSSHLPFTFSHYHPQGSYPQSLLSSLSNQARILSSPGKLRSQPLCAEDRTKMAASGPPGTSVAFSPGLGAGMGVRLENLLPRLKLKVDASSSPHDSGTAMSLMVETSCALTSTSNSLHHVSQPPLHFHLSSSSSSSPSIYYSYPPASSLSTFATSCPSIKSLSQSASSSGASVFVSMATTSTVPIAAVPGNIYYPHGLSSSSSCGTSLDPSQGHTQSMCVCSSCGCRGNCGAYGTLSTYAPASGYLQPFSANSVFTLGPLLHLSPLMASSSTTGTVTAPYSYPMMAPPPLYCQSPGSHDQQKGFSFYQPHDILGNAVQKRIAGNLSCYNCGGHGHRAEGCKQPPMESSQQGTFRLKYTPHSDNKDSGD
ncbi:zinc finger CCHC domain-containing protein 14 isoform X4 [Syngnathus acus]|uniref:zinc finger CCHC domain-containing protein 14 isoform X4 n=1 Tax=Syngnathus acus TaxID=161584 RepID=UPI001885F7C4|nr:zinc finger CCHC domain-containing protein 14 isoform X4 [Syngnathus acus]